jgi:lysyl-tRNA synthetase, class II
MTEPATGDLREARLQKLEAVRALGVDPFPRRYERTHLSEQVIESFDELAGQSVRVAGRLVGAIRLFGKAGFAHLLDSGGRIQVYFKKDFLDEQDFALFRELDSGDFVGVEGPPFRTKTGEITVEARSVTFLAKALRPLPEKWHGLTDVEKRHRQRYLDLIANEEARQTFALRSRAIRSIRDVLDRRGFVEVETPVLQSVAAGAAARPFETFSNALDQELYLRIALELYLKRCIIGGIERVYEIGRIFRNEGLSVKHNPEFTMLELYQAYADYNDMMKLVEQLVSSVAQDLLGTTRLTWGEETIDVAPPWPRRTMRELLIEHAGIDYAEHPDAESMRAAAQAAGIVADPTWSRAKIIDELMTVFVEPKLVQPTFVINYPAETTPLAKRRLEALDEVERFEAYAAGMELVNAFSELNDPIEQFRRLEAQASVRPDGEDEAQAVDLDFVEAMEHGMPPTGGLGLGIDRLVMLLTNQQSIREVILFPQLRSREGR